MDGADSLARALTSMRIRMSLDKMKEEVGSSSEVPLFSPDRGKLTRIEVNMSSGRRLGISFLRFIQPAHKCQNGGTAGRNLGDCHNCTLIL